VSFYRRYGKRALDLLLVALLLPIALPVLGAVAIAVRIGMGRPILFSQLRPGRQGELFRLWKFRSMTDVQGPDGQCRPDGERLTSLGRWLRRTSLDELPELWNVLRGEMSLVGPRPLLAAYLPRYSPRQARRHDVRPGITGLAQVRGRNATRWPERLELDVAYVERYGLALDVSILWWTIAAVFRQHGISAPGHATMEEFRGDE
jgi:lipopolysaccharide/colanic/teichoic acid biosynthesis glycosyltransferase